MGPLEIRVAPEGSNSSQPEGNMLSVLRDIDKGTESYGPGNFRGHLRAVLGGLTTIYPGSAATVLFFNGDDRINLECVAARGFENDDEIVGVVRETGESFLKKASDDSNRYLLGEAAMAAISEKFFVAMIKGRGYKAYQVEPIFGFIPVQKVLGGKSIQTRQQVCIGFVEIFHRQPEAEIRGRVYKRFVESIALKLAFIKELDEARKREEDEYAQTLVSLAGLLELKEEGTAQHSQRVVDLTLKLAARIGIGGKQLIHIKRGALLHDIGKIGIPDSILLKEGKISDEEWVIMKRHPSYAYEKLSRVDFLKESLDIPYCHHEKWDGTGYPRSLKGEEIPLSARLFSVIDVYDALTSDRHYRKAMNKKEAMEIINKQSGTSFDPEVVRAFGDMMEEE